MSNLGVFLQNRRDQPFRCDTSHDIEKEIHLQSPLLIKPPTFHCKIWEDNQSTITMATTQKFTPRTKHIALKYHHFRKWVDSKDIEISYVRTEDQQADILAKPVQPDLFFPLRHMLMG